MKPTRVIYLTQLYRKYVITKYVVICDRTGACWAEPPLGVEAEYALILVTQRPSRGGQLENG